MKFKKLLFLIEIIYVIIVFILMHFVRITGDGIFSYTLANNPYDYLFVSDCSDRPDENGWVSGELQRDYMVTDKPFDYSQVYYHQRSDVHPPLFYFLLHTVCSVTKGRFSNMQAMSVNLAFIILLIWVLNCITKLIVPESVSGRCLMLATTLLMPVILNIALYARMYMMLACFTAMYLLLHIRILKYGLSTDILIQLILIVLAGTLTHYYFYVYAALVSLVIAIYLFKEKSIEDLLYYVICGMAGVGISWTFFPYVLKHIGHKHTDGIKAINIVTFIRGWCMTIFHNFLWNKPWILVLAVGATILFTGMYIWRKHAPEIAGFGSDSSWLWMLLALPELVYSILIFGMDLYPNSGNWYYMTPAYLPFAILFALILYFCCVGVGNTRISETALIVVTIVIVALTGAANMYSRCTISRESYDKYNKWHEIAQTNADTDCVYMYDRVDNLNNDIWMEIALYKDIKRIAGSNLAETSLDDAFLRGRKSDKEYVMLYMPEKYKAEDMIEMGEVQLAMNYSGFNVFRWTFNEE